MPFAGHIAAKRLSPLHFTLNFEVHNIDHVRLLTVNVGHSPYLGHHSIIIRKLLQLLPISYPRLGHHCHHYHRHYQHRLLYLYYSGHYASKWPFFLFTSFAVETLPIAASTKLSSTCEKDKLK